MSEPMTDERRKEIEKELKPRYYVGEKVFLLASVVRECLDEIARLKGLGKKQIDRAEEIIGQLVDENTTLKEENRKMRELLQNWLSPSVTLCACVRKTRALLGEES